MKVMIDILLHRMERKKEAEIPNFSGHCGLFFSVDHMLM